MISFLRSMLRACSGRADPVADDAMRRLIFHDGALGERAIVTGDRTGIKSKRGEPILERGHLRVLRSQGQKLREVAR